MKELLFDNPVHKPGRNVTVRRGIKWDLETEAQIDGVGEVKIETRVFPCWNIPTGLLKDEHDPACRDMDGLVATMQKVYPGFDDDEIVTVVIYEV